MFQPNDWVATNYYTESGGFPDSCICMDGNGNGNGTVSSSGNCITIDGTSVYRQVIAKYTF